MTWRIGQWVVILAGRLAGRTGIIEEVWIDPTCGCITVFVRTAAGEWAGRPSELGLP